jgi:hypothetical protein
MALTLYAAVVPSYLQILESVSRLVGKAEVFCQDQGLAPEAILDARLADDMLPFAYQVKSTAVHSIGAIDGVRQGVFSPDNTPPPATFAGLAERVAEAIAQLAALDPDEVESFIGRDMRFQFGDYHMAFTAEDFLLSFSQPNFYFHATTTYDILRMKGLAIGKRDFNGRVRQKK